MVAGIVNKFEGLAGVGSMLGTLLVIFELVLMNVRFN